MAGSVNLHLLLDPEVAPVSDLESQSARPGRGCWRYADEHQRDRQGGAQHDGEQARVGKTAS